jgi:hypothetical protein
MLWFGRSQTNKQPSLIDKQTNKQPSLIDKLLNISFIYLFIYLDKLFFNIINVLHKEHVLHEQHILQEENVL